MQRCSWVNLKNERYVRYHDEEWGKPHHNDAYLFELLLLECFQAGLSWETVLNKREHFREAFDGFDPEKISRYDDAKLNELVGNPGIIRHRKKLEAAVNNAGVFRRIQQQWGTFDHYIWSFTEGVPVYRKDGPMPVTSPLSDRVSADMKKQGMKFVGSTTIYSYLQAIGVINDHDKNCDCRKEHVLELAHIDFLNE